MEAQNTPDLPRMEEKTATGLRLLDDQQAADLAHEYGLPFFAASFKRSRWSGEIAKGIAAPAAVKIAKSARYLERDLRVYFERVCEALADDQKLFSLPMTQDEVDSLTPAQRATAERLLKRQAQMRDHRKGAA